ncbi:MAG: glycoside hydrolase family 31 protein [Treponemataceae bacterium]
MPPETKFSKPQYCTWIEFIDNQNQEDILKYAKTIKEKNMPIGEIILDDGWQYTFGDWTFNKKTFPDPKKLINELKEMGFDVSLWICPFVSEKAPDYKYLEKNNLLIREPNGEVAIRKWWNGKDPILDFTNPKAREWFSKKCQWLIDEYGISGFKQDAGDPLYYRDDDLLYEKITANEHSLYWAKSALDFEYNELRACWKGGGFGIAQRLADKRHGWSRFFGLRCLVPNMLALGIIGHPFGCPDMVGGGLEFNFGENAKFDNELFVRFAQCSALMPMMQYSKSIWNLEDKETSRLCIEAANYHQKFVDYIIEVAKESANTGEPIVRYMEYEFPKSGYGKITQQFMLGDKYLVAPMVWKRKKRKIHFPEGCNWKDVETEEIINGGQVLKLAIPLDKLPVYEKIL